MVTLQVARNQVPGTRALAVSGAGLDLGWFEDVPDDVIRTTVGDLMADPERRAEMSRHGRELIDGAGADRVVDALMQVSG
jgi:UDP-2,4-diacetamido-2,4,6-trideoxy-beta-L-altropyranose hydrolase